MTRDDVLALLEEGPQLQADLVTWLDEPDSVVRFMLKGMKRDGLVKRVGDERRWALASYQPVNGRHPEVPHQVREERVLQLLEARPQRTGELMTATGWTKTVVSDTCRRLVTAGFARVLGGGNARRYALPAAVERFPVPRRGPVNPSSPWRSPQSPAATAPEPVDDAGDALPDETLEDLELDIPPRRKAAPRSVKIPVNQALPWWATAKPEGFTNLARTQQERMRSSKENLKVPFRTLQ